MEHVSTLLKTASLSVKREEMEYEESLDPHVTDIVNRLFVFFYGVCRGFDKQYQDPKRLNIEKTQWIRAFMDIGIDKLGKIKAGVKKCRLESPINTPTIGQFIKWCMPTLEELNIPNIEAAYSEACLNSKPYTTEKKWSHQAVYHAWSMCNSFELASLPKKNTFPVFERNYDITLKMILRGEELKEIPLAITHDTESEPKKKIAQGFEHCKNHKSSMEAMSRLLGKNINGIAYQG